MKKILVFLVLLLFSSQLLAGTGSGKITTTYAHDKNNSEGIVIFNVENHTSPPSCSGNEWAFDLNNELGKAMYSLLLSAATQGKTVTVGGTHDCNAWQDRERPLWIRVDY